MLSTITHELPANEPETYWRDVFFDRDVQEAIYRELGFEEPQVVAQEGSLEEGLSRTFVFAQPVRAPGPLKKLFGERQVLTERGRFDPEKHEYHFEMAPEGMLAQRIRIRGVTRVERVAEGKIARICELDCSCSIPGLSGLTERFVQSQNRDIYDQRAAIERRILQER